MGFPCLRQLRNGNLSATVQVAASKDPTRNWMMSWPWLTTCHITTRLWRLWRLRLDSPSPASTHVKLIFYITRSPPGEGMNTSSSPDGDCHVLKDNRVYLVPAQIGYVGQLQIGSYCNWSWKFQLVRIYIINYIYIHCRLYCIIYHSSNYHSHGQSNFG